MFGLKLPDEYCDWMSDYSYRSLLAFVRLSITLSRDFESGRVGDDYSGGSKVDGTIFKAVRLAPRLVVMVACEFSMELPILYCVVFIIFINLQ